MSAVRKLFSRIRFVLFTKIILIFKFCQSAGGRGGAIATKGGSRIPGPRAGDPNDDSGSLSVILVVILPVAQMFAVLVIILLVRLCYRKYCSQNNNDLPVKHGFYSEDINPSIHVNRY